MTILERYNQAFENIRSEKIEYSNYVVSYIDLLGVKDVLQCDDGLSLNRMNLLYNRLLCYVDPSNKDFFKLDNVKIKIFSDNIIIASEIKDDFTSAFKKVFRVTKMLQGDALIRNGWLLRGGISVGKLYIDDVFTMGKGIISAYNLESHIANYPRVIIDNDIIASLNLDEFKMPYGIEEIYTDFDGEKYINYLSYFNKDSLRRICEELHSYYLEMNNQESNLKVKQKYSWVINYIEVVIRWCDRFNL